MLEPENPLNSRIFLWCSYLTAVLTGTRWPERSLQVSEIWQTSESCEFFAWLLYEVHHVACFSLFRPETTCVLFFFFLFRHLAGNALTGDVPDFTGMESLSYLYADSQSRIRELECSAVDLPSLTYLLQRHEQQLVQRIRYTFLVL